MSPKTNGFLRYVLPLILYCGLIFALSSMTAPPTPTFGLDWGDKINHAGAYGVMMILAFRASRWLLRGRDLYWQLVFALVFCMVYGGSDEIHQAFVPNRECDLYDWLADASGAILAMIAIRLTLRFPWAKLIYGERHAPSS